MRIGIICSRDFGRFSLIYQLIQKIKSDLGVKNCIIVSAANGTGDVKVKHAALENDFTYVEYNPAYSGQNLHSAEKAEYYKRNFHISHLYHRYQQLFKNVDKLFIFIQEKEDDSIILKSIEKLPKNLKYVILK